MTSLTRICERIQFFLVILGVHRFIDKDCSLLGYDAMLIGNLPTFLRSLQPLSSRQAKKNILPVQLP